MSNIRMDGIPKRSADERDLFIDYDLFIKQCLKLLGSVSSLKTKGIETTVNQFRTWVIEILQSDWLITLVCQTQ